MKHKARYVISSFQYAWYHLYAPSIVDEEFAHNPLYLAPKISPATVKPKVPEVATKGTTNGNAFRQGLTCYHR